MNYILQAIPNDIYNLVDACANAHEMWKRIKRLMHGSAISDNVRHSRLMDKFDKFEAKEGESLESVYERLTTIVNIMDRNNVRPITVAINTKFLNCLQPEWSKYVTMVRQNQSDKAISYDKLYVSLVQLEPRVLASRAKKAAKNHDLEQILLAMKDEAGSHLSNKENDFMLDNAYGEESLDELTESIMLMAQLQPANETTDTVPSYDEKNPKRLKKAIAAQLKMYDVDMLYSEKLKINSADSEKTLEDAKESQNKMKDKMIQVNYDKINALYETFVPQQELFAKQTYFLIPSTSNNNYESKDVPSESPVLKMPNESRLLNMIDKLGNALSGFYTKINKTLLKDNDRRWLSDSQNELREFYKTDVIPMSRSLYMHLQDIKEEPIEEVHEMLNILSQ
nr:hypothetical protein [Tanacetum cinerariifolium]